MNNRYITDTDFLPLERFGYLYKEKEKRNQQQEELYQLIFGILYYRNVDYIYEVLMTLSINQESKIIKNVKLKIWKDELQTITTTIKKFKIKKFNVQIVLPYLFDDLYLDIDSIISSFQWAINIIEEIQNYEEELVFGENKNIVYPFPDMTYFFCRFLADKLAPNWRYDDSLDNLKILDTPIDRDKMRTDGFYNIEAELWVDEMVRRGLVNADDSCKSQYYNSEEKNYRKYFIESELKNEDLDINSPIDSQKLSENEVSDKEKTAIIYYMLQNKVDTDIIIKVCNYVLGKKYNKEIHRMNNNNVERYIRYYRKEKLDKDNINKTMIEKVSKILSEYEIEIPKNVKEFLE